MGLLASGFVGFLNASDHFDSGSDAARHQDTANGSDAVSGSDGAGPLASTEWSGDDNGRYRRAND
jgi:hypothetical protein